MTWISQLSLPLIDCYIFWIFRTKDASDSESDADSSVRHSMIGANVLESLDRAQSTATRDDDDMRELIESSMASEFSRKKKKKKRSNNVPLS